MLQLGSNSRCASGFVLQVKLGTHLKVADLERISREVRLTDRAHLIMPSSIRVCVRRRCIEAIEQVRKADLEPLFALATPTMMQILRFWKQLLLPPDTA